MLKLAGCIHDIDLSLYFLGDVIPKAVWAIGTITHHPELEALNDVDNGIGMVEYWDGKLARELIQALKRRLPNISQRTERTAIASLPPSSYRKSIRRSVSRAYDRFHDYQRTMQVNYFAAVKLKG